MSWHCNLRVDEVAQRDNLEFHNIALASYKHKDGLACLRIKQIDKINEMSKNPRKTYT